MQILVTELGDETFIIAAIMAMRHGKAIVYAGAMSALGFMTVSSLATLGWNLARPAGVPECQNIVDRAAWRSQIISTALGYILPNLISRYAPD